MGPLKKSVLIALAGMAAGIILWGGFNTVLEVTNSMPFCISCHEMRDTVYQEYRQSPHFSNPSGVRATCPDCHVPRDWPHKLLRKAQASGELFHWLAGTIDTPAKFEARRHDLARHEWARMRATGSRECRNCHSFDAMDFHKQSIRAVRAMRDAEKDGRTCIDCHRAVAHKMPDVTDKHRPMFAALAKRAAEARVVAGRTVYAVAPVALRARPEGEAEGELAAAVPVLVAEVAGEAARIELTGWRRDGEPQVLYAWMGKRLALARLTEASAARLERLEQTEDPDTGLAWTHERLTAWVPATGFLEDPAPLWAYGARMAQDNCTLCHPSRAPGAYTVNDWIGHLNSMLRLTPLTEPEGAFLRTYLQGRAKDVG